MALVVVGGHSRSVGKTSVVAGLISAMPERQWLAAKITQYGHGICSADGQPCDCATADHSWSITAERNPAGDSDTSRFLAAGARSVLWVRTRQGFLAEAMPRLRATIAEAENVILESNSVMQFLCPDLYLAVLDYSTSDFKATALRFLDRAHALIVHQPVGATAWPRVSRKLLEGKPAFRIRPPQYVSDELVAFVRQRLAVTPHGSAH